MVNEAEPTGTRKEESTLPITPAQPSNDSGEYEAHAKDKPDIPTMLPSDDRALAQVTDVGNTGLVAGFEKHPANMREPEALVGVVRIEVGVRVTMVGAVTAAPPLNRALNSTSSSYGKEVLEGF